MYNKIQYTYMYVLKPVCTLAQDSLPTEIRMSSRLALDL